MFDLFRSRDKVVRIFLGGLLCLVGLSMVTYLIPTTGTGGADNPNDQTVVATIGKDQLTSQQVSQIITSMTRNRQMPPELLSLYVPQIVQQMISDRAMAYEANRLGMQVTADEIENSILDTLPPDLVKGGKVDAATLNAVLAQQGLTMAGLKSDTARQMLVARLREIVSQGVVVSPAEVEAEYHRRNDKIKVEYALLAPEKYQAQAEPTEAEMKAYYDAHKASFQTPEKRSLGIVVLDQAKLLGKVQPSKAELEREYNSSLDAYRTPERVKVRHILIKADASNDAAMKAKAEGLLKQLQTGADFGALARANSQDPGSAAQGGELGWIQRGQTVPEFEKSAFALPPGQTSGLVKTTYGYHILQVEEHEQAHLQAFDEVEPQLAVQFGQRAANQELQKQSDKVLADLRRDPLHPEKAAAAVGAAPILANNIQSGDPVPEIGVSKDFNDAIAPLHKGEVAGPIALPGNKVAIVSVTDYQASHQASFEEARADVHNRAQQEKLQKVLAQKANDLAARAKAGGGDLQKAGKELGVEIKTSSDVDRSGAIEGVGQTTTFTGAFTAPAGSVIGPVPASGGQAVAKVISKTPADPAGLAAQSASIREQLQQQKERDRAQLFTDGLEKRLEQEGKLRIHQDVVSRIVQTYTART